MKKLLALVLALVMSMSLVTISNAAFKDADKISNKEAVDVMAAVGVLAGYDNGEFGATDTLTRAQACKIIAYLDLGGKTADAIKGTGTVFSDVKATAWYAGYVEYCAGAGYVAGVGGGKFDPDAKVTGVQFAKMLLCALGYKSDVEGYTGADYTISVARDANKNDLFNALSIVTSANLTREQAAQMALNALKADVVEYKGGTNVSTSDGTKVVINAERSTVANDKYDYRVKGAAYDAKKDNTVQQLCEKLYGKDLKGIEDKDAFGRKAIVWSYKNDEVGTYATDSADYTYYGAVSGKTLFKDLGLAASTKYTLTVDGSKSEKTGSEIKALAKDLGGYSYIVEVTVDDKDITVITIEYKLAQVSKVTKAKDGDKRSITVGGKTYETESFAKDDYVLYTVDKNGKIQSVQLAEKVTGKVTAVKGDKLTIDGTTYKFNAGGKDMSKVTAGTSGTFYLGIDKALIGASDLTEVVSAKDFMYVYSVVDAKTGEVDENGLPITGKQTAYYILTDGTKGSAKIAKDQKIDAKTVIAYSFNSDDELKVAEAKDVKTYDSLKKKVEIGKDTAVVADAYLMSADTQFVFVNIKDSKLTVTTVTGYKNVGKQSQNIFIVADKDGKALTVFVIGEDKGLETSKTFAYLLDTNPTLTKDSKDKDLYTYDVLVDGEVSTIATSKQEYMDGIAKGDRFSYTLKDGKLDKAVTKDTGTKSGEITAIVDDYIVIDGTAYSIKDVKETYLLDKGADEVKNVLTGDALEKGDTVIVYTNGKTGDNEKNVAVVITKEAE